MKSLSVADIAIGGVIAIGGYYAYKMISDKGPPNTIEDCAQSWNKLPEPYRGAVLKMFDTKNRGKALSKEIDLLTNLLEKDGHPNEAACLKKYKPEIMSDIESTEIVGLTEGPPSLKIHTVEKVIRADLGEKVERLETPLEVSENFKMTFKQFITLNPSILIPGIWKEGLNVNVFSFPTSFPGDGT